MMLGTIEYIDSWVAPLVHNRNPTSLQGTTISYIMLATFILLMPILLMNLLVSVVVFRKIQSNTQVWLLKRIISWKIIQQLCPGYANWNRPVFNDLSIDHSRIQVNSLLRESISLKSTRKCPLHYQTYNTNLGHVPCIKNNIKWLFKNAWNLNDVPIFTAHWFADWFGCRGHRGGAEERATEASRDAGSAPHRDRAETPAAHPRVGRQEGVEGVRRRTQGRDLQGNQPELLSLHEFQVWSLAARNVCACVKHQERGLWQQVMMFTFNICIFKNGRAKIKKTANADVVYECTLINIYYYIHVSVARATCSDIS